MIYFKYKVQVRYVYRDHNNAERISVDEKFYLLINAAKEFDMWEELYKITPNTYVDLYGWSPRVGWNRILTTEQK